MKTRHQGQPAGQRDIRRWGVRQVILLISAVAATTMPACGDQESEIGSTSAAAASAACGRLSHGEALSKGQSIRSCSSRLSLVLQGDGNLVLYEQGKALWHTHTYGKPINRAAMQSDGNLVLYGPSSRYYWDAKTYGKAGAYLELTDEHLAIRYPNRILKTLYDRCSGASRLPGCAAPPKGDSLIVVAGGGSGEANVMLPHTQWVARRVYRYARGKGFDDTAIHYLNPVLWQDVDGDGLDDHVVDVPNQDRHLRAQDLLDAITWAQAQYVPGDRLWIYLSGSSDESGFSVGPSPTYKRADALLTQQQLLQAINAYEQATKTTRVDGAVVVIGAFNYASAFLSGLQRSGGGRVLIAATNKCLCLPKREHSAYQSFTYNYFDWLRSGQDLVTAMDRTVRGSWGSLVGHEDQCIYCEAQPSLRDGKGGKVAEKIRFGEF